MAVQVQLCLVINKIDRLILELQLQPQEAYERIKGIITQVNMIVSAFESESFMSEADAVLAHENTKANADTGYDSAPHLSAVWYQAASLAPRMK